MTKILLLYHECDQNRLRHKKISRYLHQDTKPSKYYPNEREKIIKNWTSDRFKQPYLLVRIKFKFDYFRSKYYDNLFNIPLNRMQYIFHPYLLLLPKQSLKTKMEIDRYRTNTQRDIFLNW